MTSSAHAKHSEARLRPRRQGGGRLTDHERVVLRAEVKTLVMALSPYGVLRRDVLARAAGADRWHEATFERALTAAVEAGEIKALPLDFYCICRR